MAYQVGGSIQAVDYNTLVGGNPTTTANTLNATWATGGSSAGYGQAALANVSVGQSVLASQWAGLVSNTASAASHQGSSITSVSAPVAGGVITYVAAIVTNLSTIYSNRLNAAAQGTTTSNTATFGSTWQTGLTFTHTATFANGDAARYFFNSGGQLAMTVSHPGGTNMNLLFNNLCSNVGTVVISSPSSGAITVAGTSYNGVTKIGGGGNSPTVDSTKGYYGLTTANSTVFTQTASTGPSGYLSTFIRFIAKTNGVQGSNSDNGSVITIYTIWDEVPDGGSALSTVGTGSATTLTVRPPSTTNISNTWGTITLAGSVTGS
jgi:hypothetical protein